MRLKTLALFGALVISSMPILANADITIVNNTDSYGTGTIGGVCSSMIGDDGVMKPHQTMVVPQIAFDLFCDGPTCEAKVFLSKNCGGKPVASATIHPKKGVMSVQNFDQAHYDIVGSGNMVTINPVV